MCAKPLGAALLGALALLGASGWAACPGSPAREPRAHVPADAGVLLPAVEAPPPARCKTQRVTAVGWPASPSGAAVLTVHVTQRGARQGATVGWASLDGQRMSILNPVYGTPMPTYQGTVPAEQLRLYVDGLFDSEAYEAHGQVDLRQLKAAELTIALKEPRKLLLREVVVRDHAGQPIAGVLGLPVLDGSAAGLRNAVANFQQWISDDQGVLRVRSVAGDVVKIAISVPLVAQPIEVTLMPGDQGIGLDDVTIVRCTFRCPATDKPTYYPGYVALTELPDGTCNRFEKEESDGLASGDIMVAWTEGTRKLTVSSSPYVSTTITSPDQKCELHPRPERASAFWD